MNAFVFVKYRQEELIFKDVWDYHLTSIDSIVEGNDGEYPACPQMLESCTGNGETPVEVIPSGAKKVMNSDGSCKYVSPLAQITGVDSDGNAIDESTKTLMDQWAYSIVLFNQLFGVTVFLRQEIFPNPGMRL